MTSDGVHILAANTHLYFDPNFEEVKALQILLSLRYINRILEKIGLDIHVIFAGDFNCTPDTEAVVFIRGESMTIYDRNDKENNLYVESNFK